MLYINRWSYDVTKSLYPRGDLKWVGGLIKKLGRKGLIFPNCWFLYVVNNLLKGKVSNKFEI